MGAQEPGAGQGAESRASAEAQEAPEDDLTVGAPDWDSEQGAILSVVVRLRQIRDEQQGDRWPWLLGRVLDCDLPRLERHLSEETSEWVARADAKFARHGGEHQREEEKHDAEEIRMSRLRQEIPPSPG